jgi:hypothetical protein
MSELEVRRYRGVVDDVIGGALTFLLELTVVLCLLAVALAVAAVVMAVN